MSDLIKYRPEHKELYIKSLQRKVATYRDVLSRSNSADSITKGTFSLPQSVHLDLRIHSSSCLQVATIQVANRLLFYETHSPCVLYCIHSFCCMLDFWDIVVITAIDESQQKYYEDQIEERIRKKEIPKQVK